MNAENAETAIQLDGEPRSWTVTEDGEVWTTPSDLADGDHTLSIAATPIDLAGKPLDEVFERTFRIEPTHLGLIVYRRPDPSRLPTSATGTALTFQGLELDAETGLLYVRNRYFDPELGRFITADPTGYPDGPNGYAFGAGDAVNGRDPMGLANSTSGVSQPELDYARMERDVKAAGRFLADPYVQGTLQILGGCSEATLGAIAAAGSAGLVAAPGLLAVLHGSDTCAAGFKAIYYGKNQNSLTAEGVKAALISSGVSPSRAELGANVFDAILGAGLSANAARSLLPGARAAVVPATRAKLTNQEILDLGKGPLSREAAAEEIASQAGSKGAFQAERLKANLAAEELSTAPRVGSGLKADAAHRSGSFVVGDVGGSGRVFTVVGGDGVKRTLTQVEGTLNENVGIFEWIVDPNGSVTHQRFIPGGRINGIPNQPTNGGY